MSRVLIVHRTTGGYIGKQPSGYYLTRHREDAHEFPDEATAEDVRVRIIDSFQDAYDVIHVEGEPCDSNGDRWAANAS
jgi:hypothetical protein